MALVNQDLDLAANLVLRQRPSFDLLVARAKGAVGAVVGAQIGYVEWRKKHQPRPVDLILHRTRGLKDLAQQLGITHGGQGGHLLHLQSGQPARLGQHRAHVFRILAGGCRQHTNDFAFVYESYDVVHVCPPYPTSFPGATVGRCTVKVVPTSG